MKKLLFLIAGVISLQTFAQDVSTPKNIVYFSPVSVSTTNLKGFSAGYERYLGNRLSINVPVSYSFGNSSPCDPNIITRMARITPGVKFYPFGNNRTVSYASGLSLQAGTGSTNCNCGADDLQTATPETVQGVAPLVVDYTMKPMQELGVMVMNTINIKVNKHIYLGSELGIGAGMYRMERTTSADIAFKFAISAGYMF